MDRYLEAAAGASESEFADRCPHPVLILAVSGSEEQEPLHTFKTISISRAALASATGAAEVVGGKYRALVIQKQGGNEWEDWITLGRAPNNDLVLHDASVSKLHALLRVQDGATSIQDAGSRNGTRVGARKLAERAPVVLTPGEGVLIGTVQTVFHDPTSFFRFLCALTDGDASEFVGALGG